MGKYDNIPSFFKKNIGKDTQMETDILADKAAAAIAGLSEQYLNQVQSDMVVMRDLLNRARTADAAERFRLIRDDFFGKVHDMKGQGATFDYPLLTDLGGFACDYLRLKKEITPADLEVLDGLVADMDTVLSHRLTGEGGALGQKIRAHLIQDKDRL